MDGGVIGSVVMGGRVVVGTDDSRVGRVGVEPDPLPEQAATAIVPIIKATPTRLARPRTPSLGQVEGIPTGCCRSACWSTSSAQW
jgi:hypothetical protein